MMRSSDDTSGAEDSGSPPDLVVTASRAGRRFLALVRCQVVALSLGELNLLLALVAARDNWNEAGYLNDPLTAYPMAVHRLRKTLDEQLGAGEGRRLIETGVSGQYRLAPELNASLDGRLLSASAATPQDLSSKLRTACRVLSRQALDAFVSDCSGHWP